MPVYAAEAPMEYTIKFNTVEKWGETSIKNVVMTTEDLIGEDVETDCYGTSKYSKCDIIKIAQNEKIIMLLEELIELHK